ncbi:MAG: hypothetical protein FWC40_05725 [Proteobacteria bacterium]|nr:hypothetical protein [Pseudomonadota bacterium]
MKRVIIFAVWLSFFALMPFVLLAQPLAGEDIQGLEAESEESLSVAESGVAGSSVYDDPAITPRDMYNFALTALENGDFEVATEGFGRARNLAGFDNELRFSAAYNLAFAYAARADAQGDPNALELADLQAVLDDLGMSAAWFRDAAGQRSGNFEAKANLEIVLKRIVAVNDILQRKYYTLEVQLEEVMGAQQAIRTQSRALSERIVQSQTQRDPVRFQEEFRKLSAEQRANLTAANLVAENAASALAAIEATPQASRTQEEALRGVQLQMVTPLLEQARQMMARARRQLRDMSMEDANRLTNQSYYLIKQAREQLYDPLRILQHLIQDQDEVVRLVTGRWMLTDPASLASLEASHPGQNISLPAWLNQTLLTDSQGDVLVRTSRLVQLFEAVSDAPAPETEDPQQARQAEAQRAQILEALPLLQAAVKQMQLATAAVLEDELSDGRDHAVEALKLLAQAAERFADLRHLIEVAYATQTQITSELVAALGLGRYADDQDEASQRPVLSPEEVRAMIAPNIERLTRMEGLIQQERANMEAQSEESSEQMAQVFEQAELLRKRALMANQRLVSSLRLFDEEDDEDQADSVVQHVAQKVFEDAGVAEESIEALRMLFFTIVEHVAELYRQQARTLDETADLVGESAEEQVLRLAPVIDRQRMHEALSEQLTGALHEQAKKMGENAQGMDPKQQADMAQRYLQAASELQGATGAMRQALADLQGDNRLLQEGMVSQETALEHIQAALELLQPPPPDSSQDQDQSQQQQKMSKEQAEKRSQQIRSREQERRRSRQQREASGMPTVERDW